MSRCRRRSSALEVPMMVRWEALNLAGVRDRLELRKDPKGKTMNTPSSIRETTDGFASIADSTLRGCDVTGTRFEPSAAEVFKSRIEMRRLRVDGPVWSLTLIRSWASEGAVSDKGEMSIVTLGCRIENLPVVSLKIPHSSCGPNRSDAWSHGKGGRGEMRSLRSRSRKTAKEEIRII